MPNRLVSSLRQCRSARVPYSGKVRRWRVKTGGRKAGAKHFVARPRDAGPSRKPAFSGRYYGYEGRTLHTWDFNPDGTFRHTSIAVGVGTSVRASEKGAFRMLGQFLELALASGATGFTAPAVGGRGAVVGGAADRMAEVRRLRIEFQSPGQGILLDGISMKVKSW